jgi:protein-tyrosine phosphatase
MLLHLQAYADRTDENRPGLFSNSRCMSGPIKPSHSYRTILRSFAPNSLLKERDTYLRLGPEAGSAYVRLRILNMLGLARSQAVVPKTPRSFLFVCFGNIMRSPMAESLFRKELGSLADERSVRIASAGLHATPGNLAHPWALASAAKLGISLEQHRAQLLTAAMVREADAIFAMDFQNKAELLTLYPEAKARIFMLRACLQDSSQMEIPDPYFGNVEATLDCYRMLQSCVRNLAHDLFPGSNG